MHYHLFHVKRLHTATPKGHVNDPLVHRYNFGSQGAHIHIVCEGFD